MRTTLNDWFHRCKRVVMYVSEKGWHFTRFCRVPISVEFWVRAMRFCICHAFCCLPLAIYLRLSETRKYDKLISPLEAGIHVKWAVGIGPWFGALKPRKKEQYWCAVTFMTARLVKNMAQVNQSGHCFFYRLFDIWWAAPWDKFKFGNVSLYVSQLPLIAE